MTPPPSSQPATEVRPPAGRTSLWRHADFLKLWGGETLSQLGSQVTLLALPLTAIISLHAGPREVGLLTASQFAPYVLVTLFAGVWLDSHRRRPALLVANLARFVLLGAIPLLWALGSLSVPVLCLLAFGAGTFSAVFDIAYLVYLPSLVDPDQMVEANAKLEATYSIAQVGGPGLGGILVQAFTAPVAILADAVSYLLGALSVARIRRPEPAPPPREPGVPVHAEIRSGLRSTFGHPLLRPLTLASAWFNLFDQATLTLVVLYAVRGLGLAPGLLGAVLAVGAVGGLLGTVVAARLGRLLGTGRTLAAMLLVASLGLVAVPSAGGGRALVVLTLIAGFAVYGFGTAVYNVHSLSLRIAASPPQQLARITAIYRFAVYGTIPLGALLGGALGASLGLRPALVITVAALTTGSAGLALSRIRTVTTLDTATG